MPILSNKPVTVDGKVFDRLAVSVAISPVFKDNEVRPNVSIRLDRYRKDENGVVEKLDSDAQSIVYSGQVNNDEAFEGHIKSLMDNIQAIINTRGL